MIGDPGERWRTKVQWRRSRSSLRKVEPTSRSTPSSGNATLTTSPRCAAAVCRGTRTTRRTCRCRCSTALGSPSRLFSSRRRSCCRIYLVHLKCRQERRRLSATTPALSRRVRTPHTISQSNLKVSSAHKLKCNLLLLKQKKRK